MNKKWSAFFFLLGAVSLHSQIISNLLVQEEKARLYDSFISNQATFNLYLEKSNTYLTTVLKSNTQIIKTILADENYFGGNEILKSQFLNESAEHLFLRETDEGLRQMAFSNWRKIQTLNLRLLSQIKLTPLETYEDKRTDVNQVALDRSFEIDRYRFETGTNSEDAERAFISNYEPYDFYYTNGYQAGSLFRLNMGIYYWLQGRLDKAQSLFEILGTDSDGYYLDRVQASRISKIQDDAQKQYQTLKNYLLDMRNRAFFRNRLEDKYFDLAESSLLPVNEVKKDLSRSFENIPVDRPDALQTAMDYYDKAAAAADLLPLARYNQGLIYLKLERYPNALYVLEDALKRSASFPVIYTLGLTHLKMQNYDKAYACFLEARIYDDKQAALYNNLAQCALYLTNAEKKKLSSTWISKAIELEDKNFNFYLTKADILKSTGDTNGCVRELKRAESILVELNQSKAYEDMKKYFYTSTTNRLPDLMKDQLIITRRQLDALGVAIKSTNESGQINTGKTLE